MPMHCQNYVSPNILSILSSSKFNNLRISLTLFICGLISSGFWIFSTYNIIRTVIEHEFDTIFRILKMELHWSSVKEFD